MGRSSKLKKLRKFAAQFPQQYTTAVIGHKIVGSAVTEDINPDKVPINPKLVYNAGKQTVVVPVNHVRKLKDVYKAKKLEGVRDYVQDVRIKEARDAEMIRQHNEEEKRKAVQKAWEEKSSTMLADLAAKEKGKARRRAVIIGLACFAILAVAAGIIMYFKFKI